jgi:hypothetical protein
MHATKAANLRNRATLVKICAGPATASYLFGGPSTACGNPYSTLQQHCHQTCSASKQGDAEHNGMRCQYLQHVRVPHAKTMYRGCTSRLHQSAAPVGMQTGRLLYVQASWL